MMTLQPRGFAFGHRRRGGGWAWCCSICSRERLSASTSISHPVAAYLRETVYLIRPYFCHTHRIPIAYRSAPFSQECPYMHSASTGLGDTPRRRAISYSPKMAGPAPVINTSRYAWWWRPKKSPMRVIQANKILGVKGGW